MPNQIFNFTHSFSFMFLFMLFIFLPTHFEYLMSSYCIQEKCQAVVVYTILFLNYFPTYVLMLIKPSPKHFKFSVVLILLKLFMTDLDEILKFQYFIERTVSTMILICYAELSDPKLKFFFLLNFFFFQYLTEFAIFYG